MFFLSISAIFDCYFSLYASVCLEHGISLSLFFWPQLFADWSKPKRMLTSGPSIQTDKIYTFCLFGRNSLSNTRGGREKKKEKEDREGRVKCVEGGWNSEELKRAEARSKGKKELSGLGIVVSGGKKGGGTWWTGSRPEFPYVFFQQKKKKMA